MAIYLIFKLSKGSNGSDVRWKAIPQLCPTVAEAPFQKIGTRLWQSQRFYVTKFAGPAQPLRAKIELATVSDNIGLKIHKGKSY